MTNKVIGQGTYGCVIKPALECKKKYPESTYKNKVSKIMNVKDANDELKEMAFLTTLKGVEKYAISMPIKCNPKIDDNFINVVKTCERTSENVYYDVKYNRLHRLSQLLLEDGGLNFVQAYSALFIDNTIDYDEVKHFYTSILNLFDGLEFFRDNQVVHFDIKLINLVYNIEEGIAKFIDFGMMKKDSTIKDAYSKNKAWYSVSHFNFPPENSCGSKWKFTYNFKCDKYRDGFTNYEEFLEKLVNTFDCYSLCYALIDLFKLTYNYDKKNKNFILNVIVLLGDYGNPNLMLRNHDLNLLRNIYKRLLETHKVFKIKKNKSVSPQLKEVVDKIKNKNIDDNILKDKCDKLNKDFNPLTKRCLNKCKSGFERNADFKCVKMKKNAKETEVLVSQKNFGKELKSIINKNSTKKNIRNNKSIKKIVDCLRDNKDYNPQTKRCNKRCKKGQIRNKDFKCVNIKKKNLSKRVSFSLNKNKTSRIKNKNSKRFIKSI